MSSFRRAEVASWFQGLRLALVSCMLAGTVAGTVAGCWNPLAGDEECCRVDLLGPSSVESDPVWSPDGETIAYYTDYEIHLVDASGSNDRLLTSGVSPDWSPDGRRIVFMRSWDIFTIDVDGDSLMQLTSGGTGIMPAWSPDGNWIAYTGFASDTQSVWIMAPDGTDKTDLRLPGGAGPDWSPDGRKLAFCQWKQSRCIIAVYDMETGRVAEIGDPGRHNIAPQWSPTGTKIAFSAEGFEGRGPADGLPSQQVWVMNADGSQQRQLTKGSGMFPAWSPDGARIVYNQVNWEGGRLWIMDRDGRNKRPVRQLP